MPKSAKGRLLRFPLGGSGKERADAALTIFSDDIAAAEITSILRLAPSRTLARGELSVPGDETTARRDHYWSFASTLPSTRPVEEHLSWLADKLETRRPALSRLRRSGCRMRLFSGYSGRSTLGSVIEIPVALMRRLGRLGLPLHLDVYPLPEDREERRLNRSNSKRKRPPKKTPSNVVPLRRR